MKKKVAIITIISENYGNRLQNYALQRALEKLGFMVKTIPIKKQKRIKRILKTYIKRYLSIFIERYKNYCWNKFDLKINWSRYTVKDPQINDKYDFFVAGSDQIWNPLFSFNSEREFLTFADDNKKIAYAASIGLECLPEENVENYRNWIETFKFVSVREEAAAKIIKMLGCTEPITVLDPTMLLTSEEWKNISKQSKIKLGHKYVVKYFLGIRNKEFDRYIEKKAQKEKADIVDMMDDNSSLKGQIGPIEFVNLICNSCAVFTDSFHGTVFAILFHKPFVVFERPYEEGYGKMTSRLDTLLKTFHLESQRVISPVMCETAQLKWDYKRTQKILEEKKSDSLKFLQQALKENT